MALRLSYRPTDRPSKLLAAIILTLMLLCSCDGSLTVKPTNIEAVVGQRVRFNCSTSEPYYVLWDHALVGSTSRSYIFFSGVLVLPYSQRLQLDRDSSVGVYNLVIPSVQKEDAGNYRCMDMVGHGEQAEAELVVLDSSPQCETDAIKFCEGTSQDFSTSCTVGYRGNLVPKIECSADGVTTFSSAVNGLIENSVTYNLQLTAHWPLHDGHPIACRTSVSHVTSIVRPKVMYACGSTRTLNFDLRNPESVDCKANSSEHCSYQWIHKDTSAVICSSQTLPVGLREAGQYVCVATCILQDQMCVVTPLVVNLPTQEDIAQRDMPTMHTGITIGLAVGVSLILIVVGVLVIVYIVRKGCGIRSSDPEAVLSCLGKTSASNGLPSCQLSSSEVKELRKPLNGNRPTQSAYEIPVEHTSQALVDLR